MSFESKIKDGSISLKKYVLAFHREYREKTDISNKIFYNSFFVNNNTIYKKTINEIKQFVEDDDEMFLILKGGAGNGKSVFVDSLHDEFSPAKQDCFNNINIQVLDWADLTDYGCSNLIQKIRKTFSKFVNSKTNEELQHIINYIRSLNIDGQKLVYAKLMHAVRALFIKPEEDPNFDWSNVNKTEEFCEQQIVETIKIGKIRRDSSKAAKEAVGILEEEYADSNYLFLIALWILILSLYKPDKPILIIYDNVEAVSPKIADKICELIGGLPSLYGELRLDNFYNKKIKHIFVCRTTNLQILADHEFSRDVVTEIDLPYFDFAPIAIKKRHDYLYGINLDSNNKILCYMELLSKLFLDQDESEKLKEGYILRKFLPLFGNNFRNVIGYSFKALNQFSEEIAKLLDYDHVCVTERINGARAILVKAAFDQLIKNNTLENMGIELLDRKDSHSRTRMLINYLYWYTKYDKKDNGIELKKIYEDLRYFFDENGHNFGSTVKSISIFNKIPVTQWDNLIDFTNLASNNYSFNEEQANESNLKVKINSTAKIFVDTYSFHFEFFNARMAEHKALFLISDANELAYLLTDMAESIEHFINGMLKESVCKICKILAPTSSKNYCNLENNNTLYNCSLYTRIRQIIWCLTDNIDYVDRYRISMSYEKESNNCWDDAVKINLCCLDFMLKLTKNYEYVYNEIFTKNELFRKSFVTDKNSDLRLAIPSHYFDEIPYTDIINKLQYHMNELKNINTEEQWFKYFDRFIYNSEKNQKIRIYDIVKKDL